jgi:hypothetical protein
MRMNWLSSMVKPKAAILLALISFCRLGAAQQVSYALLHPNGLPRPSALEPAPVVKTARPLSLPETPALHRFFDRDNTVLFATSAAFSTADFVVTRSNLNSGGQELNPVTRVFSGSTAGLAMNFVGETAGVVGLSYFFHRTGHHRLERAVSMVNIGSSAVAVGFGLAHR